MDVAILCYTLRLNCTSSNCSWVRFTKREGRKRERVGGGGKREREMGKERGGREGRGRGREERGRGKRDGEGREERGIEKGGGGD